MDDGQFQKIAKALADPRRFEIFQTITASSVDGMCCGQVCEKMPVAQATVSHHLKELTGAGLLELRSEGQFRFWSVKTEVINEYIAELQSRLRLLPTKRGK
jgi:ArsR family transcriptional regulator